MSSTPPGESNTGERAAGGGPLPAFVEWILGAVIALGGLLLVGGGAALEFAVDRDLIATGVEDGTITVTVGMTELTDAEALEVTDAVVSWTGPGLLLTGVGLIAVAVAFVVARRRARRRARTDEPLTAYGAIAVLGAVVTAVLSFVPVSPLFGGAVAGYLERGESERTVSVGVLAGVLPLLPVLAVGLFVLGGMVDGLLAVDQAGNAVVAGLALVLSYLLIAALGAGLGALGGYLGGKLAEN